MLTRPIVLSLALALAAALPVAAHVTLDTMLDAAQETPAPTLAPGANPTPNATLSLETDNSIEYQITFSGLSGTPTAAHIHHAPPGTPGPIIIGLDANTLSGTTPPLDQDQLTSLFRGDGPRSRCGDFRTKGRPGWSEQPSRSASIDRSPPSSWPRCR